MYEVLPEAVKKTKREQFLPVLGEVSSAASPIPYPCITLLSKRASFATSCAVLSAALGADGNEPRDRLLTKGGGGQLSPDSFALSAAQAYASKQSF